MSVNETELFGEFCQSVEAGDYEASDEKARVIRRLSNDEKNLIKLAMAYAYEEGYREGGYSAA